MSQNNENDEDDDDIQIIGDNMSGFSSVNISPVGNTERSK